MSAYVEGPYEEQPSRTRAFASSVSAHPYRWGAGAAGAYGVHRLGKRFGFTPKKIKGRFGAYRRLLGRKRGTAERLARLQSVAPKLRGGGWRAAQRLESYARTGNPWTRGLRGARALSKPARALRRIGRIFRPIRR